ncbi:N-formylglutamate amidohydrolase [Litorimonas sp. WD9-15]|uniref:N-formylglutamate amidohydrolase n=1 Tax=Litorimonas sp. WD9-15 TaxID=3418716 RepID=UPI003D07E7F6
MSEPFHHIPGDTSVPLFLFGDHASKFIPARYDNLGLSGDDLTRHIAWDIGTEAVIRGLCARFGNTGIVAGFSRLLIDPNRGLENESLIPEFSDGTDIPSNANVTAAVREERIETLYRPYHNALSAALDQQDNPLTISVHSFTPKPNLGDFRAVNFGLLVKDDIETAEVFQTRLSELAPELSIGVNKPYSAYDLNHTVDTHVSPRDLPHLAIEIRQDHIGDQQGVARMVSILGDALEPMMGA